MTVLNVPGADLYYETVGAGPHLLMIPGASGDGRNFGMVASYLASDFTVVTYDRSGFFRSQLTGEQNYDHRLETDADDARCLIDHLSDEPAIAFGASSGAIVALELLIRDPSAVRALVPFEPPAMKLLGDGERWIDFFHEVYDLYRSSGAERALSVFRERSFPPCDGQTMAAAMGSVGRERAAANAAYWFEHELRQYPAARLDLVALRMHARRIVVTAGCESRGYPTHEVSEELSRALNSNMVEFPGGHLGLVAHPAEFARELARALKVSGLAE